MTVVRSKEIVFRVPVFFFSFFFFKKKTRKKRKKKKKQQLNIKIEMNLCSGKTAKLKDLFPATLI